MKHIKFVKSSIQGTNSLLRKYLQSLTGVVDDFWEEHILTADIYLIQKEEKAVGCFAIHSKDKITMFYIQHEDFHMAQDVFKKILSCFCIQTALVATCDPLFLNLCLDFHKKIELQAYFFKHSGNNVRPQEYSRDLLRLAVPGDEVDILDSENVTENIALGKYYVMRENGVFIGQGFFNMQTLIPGAASIGMSVHPDFRRKGVGRSIIMHLADICREKGVTPHCGCWYHNHNSKATLESAGFVAQTRLLNVFIQANGGIDSENAL